MSDINTQVEASRVIYIKAQEIPTVTQDEVPFNVSDDIKVENVQSMGPTLNVREAYANDVLNKAKVTPVVAQEEKSKLPWVIGAAIALFTLSK